MKNASPMSLIIDNPTNKRAWDDLYAATPDLVWGAGEVGFLRAFLAPERRAQRRFTRILDAATGEGRNLPFLLDLGGRVSACDSSGAALAKIPARVGARVDLVCCDLSRTPFPTGSFDLILLCDTIETLPEPEPVLHELRRVLVPGGGLVCNFPEVEGDVAGINMEPAGRKSYLYQGRYYFRFFEEADIESLLAGTGWRLGRSEGMSWEEGPHPRFRAVAHRHRSRVCLLEAEGGQARGGSAGDTGTSEGEGRT